MTARFQGPLVDPATGCVKFSIQSSAVRPSDTVDFRGMAVSPDGLVYSINDTGQPRVFQDGIAIDPDTGLTIVGPGPVVNISMGGLGVNAAGAVVLNSPPDVIHQGVGITNSSELCGASVATATLFAFGEEGSGVLKGLVTGTGSMTFARSSTATVTDFEGLVKPTLANELRFEYGRRVYNIVGQSTPVFGAAGGQVTVTNDVAYMGKTATRAVWDSGFSGYGDTGVLGGATMRPPDGALGGHDYVLSPQIYLSRVLTGAEEIVLYSSVEGGTYWLQINSSNSAAMTGQWARVTPGPVTENADNPQVDYVMFVNGALTSELTLHIAEMQQEDVTSQANQNPSEYVSVGVLGGDYHGVGVDGVKAFAYENGNTVDGNNVVTEAKGSDLTTDWRAMFEPAATNYADTSDDLTGGAETVDLTTGGTGDYTLSVGGTAAVTVAAGTATGTGFAQATDGNPVTFNLSVTGTVTLTLDSGTLGTAQGGWALKQVEKASVASSWISTSGGSATRAVDDGTPFAQVSGNVDETEGMLIFELKASTSSANLPATTAIASLADAVNNLFRLESASPQLKSFDGVNTASDILAFAADNRYRFAVRWSAAANEFQVGYQDIDGAGAWQWGTVATFDGAFEVGTAINIFYGGPNSPMLIRNSRIYDSDQGTSWIEANY